MVAMQMANQLRAIQDSLIEATAPGRLTTEVGPFVAMLLPSDPLIWLNYAVPTAEPSLGDIEDLVAHFRLHERAPRLEFNSTLWPEACVLLEKAGFECEKRMPLMILPSDQWVPQSPSVDVRTVGQDSINQLQRIVDEAFGMEPKEEDSPTENLGLMSGRIKAVMAISNNTPAAGGYAIGTKAIREIAGIGTLEAFRRRGLAKAVITQLLNDFFADGGEIAWLTPGDDGAEALYTGLGFRAIAEQVCYIKHA